MDDKKKNPKLPEHIVWFSKQCLEDPDRIKRLFQMDTDYPELTKVLLESDSELVGLITDLLTKSEDLGNKKVDKSEEYEEDMEEKEPRKDEETDKSATPVDLVIIVAVPAEKKGVIGAFGVKGKKFKNDLSAKYKFNYLQFNEQGLNVVLVIQPAMGMAYAASLATRTVLAFNPKLIAMVGICGGKNGKTKLGDIIIASNVFDYTAGKRYSDRMGYRPLPISVKQKISGFVNESIIGNHTLTGKILTDFDGAEPDNPVTVHLAPIATGTIVVDDPEIVAEVASRQDDLAGIDMEAYALAVAADALDTHWIVIKAVQDFADGAKSETEKNIRPFAAFASAKLLRLVMEDLLHSI